MSDDVHIIDPCASDEWLRFVTTHPDAGIFHHPAWMSMLRDVYGYRIFAVCLMNENGIRAGIPFADVQSFITGKRWISLPFSDHCRPLLSERAEADLEKLIGYLSCKQNEATPKVEIRWGISSTHQLFRETNFVIHSLDLAGHTEASIFKTFNQQAQRSIKRAEKEGVTVKECSSFEEFEAYYDLQVLTRKRLGVPAQPRTFFKGVWEYMLRPGLGFALICFDGGTPIGGGVFLKFNRTLAYKFGASDMAYKNLQPNYAFMWGGIKRALADGCTTFDFGRSDMDNEGLKRFKRGWGTKEYELAYTILSSHPPKSGASKLNRIVGSVIRRSPKFVCTMTGKLLYKHFA